MGLGAKEAAFFARLAQGSLGLACQWARLELDGVGLFEIKKSVVASLADYKMIDALALAERVLENAKQIATGWADLDKATSKSDLTRRADKTLIQIILAALRDVTIASAGRRPAAHQRGPGGADRQSGPPSRPRAGRWRRSATATRCSAGSKTTSTSG